MARVNESRSPSRTGVWWRLEAFNWLPEDSGWCNGCTALLVLAPRVGVALLIAAIEAAIS